MGREAEHHWLRGPRLAITDTVGKVTRPHHHCYRVPDWPSQTLEMWALASKMVQLIQVLAAKLGHLDWLFRIHKVERKN